MKGIRYYFEALRSFFVPSLCPVCGREMEHEDAIICPVCHARMPRVPIPDITDNAVVRALWTVTDAPFGFSLFYYRHESDFHSLLIRMKYHGDTNLAFRLGQLAARELKVRLDEANQSNEANPIVVDGVVPVPMNKRRRRLYGYNQSEFVARGIADVLGCPMWEWLERHDELSSQSRLSQRERTERQMLLSAAIPTEHHGKTILLVDDVITTGTTMMQCAQTLLKADPSLRICVFALAKA